MTRKLIQLSPSTSVVSLPSSWVHKNKLKKGDALFVEENDNRLVISADAQSDKKEITLDIKGLSGKLLWSQIDAAYIAGYDSIILLTRDYQQSALLSKMVKYFPGMIIFEERQNSVHIKDIAQDTKGELDKIISRIFNMNIALIEDCQAALNADDWKQLEECKTRDFALNCYFSYYLRQLNKFGYCPYSKLGIIHTYIKTLEMLSDKICAFFVAAGSAKSKAKVGQKAVSDLLDIYRGIYRVHFNYSTERMNAIDRMRVELADSDKDSSSCKQSITDILDLIFSLEELEMQFHV